MDAEDESRQHCQLVSEYLPSVVVRYLITTDEESTPTDEMLLPMSKTYETAILAIRANGLSDIGNARIVSSQIATADGREVYRYTTVLKTFLDLVHCHGGDLVFMDGDLLVFSWTGDTDLSDVATTTRHAIVAAMNAVVRVGKRSGKNFLFSVTAGVASGTVEIFFTGDAKNENCSFLLQGAVYEAALSSLKEAKVDEVVVSAESWKPIKGFFGPPVRTTAEGDAVMDLNFTSASELMPAFKPGNLFDVTKAVPEDALENLEGEMMFYVPQPILQTLSHEGPDQEKWASERRCNATVLRIRVGIPALKLQDKKRGLVYIHETVRTVFGVVRHYTGCVLHMLEGKDETGQTEILITACFGLPSMLHEDGAERAVLCALKIRVLMDGRFTRAALTSGLVYCGCVGCDNSKRYTVLGQPLSHALKLADQLNAKAPILTDELTYQKATAAGEVIMSEVSSDLAKTVGHAVKGRKYYMPQDKSVGIGSEFALKAFNAQLQHRREVWGKSSHEAITIDKQVVKTPLMFTPGGTASLIDKIISWHKAGPSRGLSMISVEGGLGHGKSEIMKHTICKVVQMLGTAASKDEIMHGFISADPLQHSSADGLSSFAQLLHDIFVREGLKTAAAIQMAIQKACKKLGKNFESLLPWLAILNEVLPFDFTESSEVTSLLKAAKDEGPDGDMYQMAESTQRAVMLGVTWALSAKHPLLLAVDNALEMDLKSWDLMSDFISSGSNIISQYDVLNPALTDFLLQECTPVHKAPRSICVILGMHSIEEVQDVIPSELSSIIKSCIKKPGTEGNRFIRGHVPLLSKAKTVEVFLKSVQAEFPKAKALDDAAQKKIFLHTEGNPLFIHEIAVEIMKARKSKPALMTFGTDESTISLEEMEPQDLGLPPGLELKLGMVVDHQHLAAQLILKLIAVSRRPLTFGEVYHAFPLDHHLEELPSEFEHLVEQELIMDINHIPEMDSEEDVDGKRMKQMKFWFTTEFLHHTIERRLLFEIQKPLEKAIKELVGKDLTIPEHVFEDHSCATEWGTSWGAEELWRKTTAKREREKAKSDAAASKTK